MKEKYESPQLHVFHLDTDLLLTSGPSIDDCSTGSSFSGCGSEAGGCKRNWDTHNGCSANQC